MQKLLLIDGNAILHRAYHALPPLSKNGKMVNAVYGFFSMLLKIVGDIRPEYLIVCFDRPKPTFRKALYVGYQSQRPEMDDDLSSQIKTVHEALEAGKVEVFELDGYEADDLIGTISVKALEKEKDLTVVIVSGDRDLLQLVNSNVKVLAPITGITNMILFDEAKVEEKYGLKPRQIVDYKALVGDSSDNYPGVSGIGPKTASTLIKKYETFENLYENIGELPEKTAQKLATDAEQAALAKKLAEIVIDAPITLDMNKAKIEEINKYKLVSFFQNLGFKSLIERAGFLNKENPELKNTNSQLDLL